jgi:hypothetical protein
MRNRRVYATEDNDLSIIYTLNDLIMGTISDSDAATASIKVQISDRPIRSEALLKLS